MVSSSIKLNLSLSQDPDEGSVYYHPVYFQVNEEDTEQREREREASYTNDIIMM